MTDQPMNFFRTETVDHSKKLTEEVAMFSLLDKSLVKIRREEEANRYKDRPKTLGAGRVGHPMAPVPYDRGCERALWFEMKQYPSERPFTENLYRIFSMGHAAEEIVAENLRAAGFTLMTHDANGNQFGFALAHDPQTGHPRFKGFCDGVIIDGPKRIGDEKDGVELRYPFLWENKAVNDKKFNKFVSEGVERSHPQYYSQMQIYMNFLNLYQNPGLLTMLNRESGHIRCEFVRYNQRHCQAIIDRAARIVEAKGPLVLERAAQDYEKLPCKWCDFKGHCQQAEQNRTTTDSSGQQAAPSWLSQSQGG